MRCLGHAWRAAVLVSSGMVWRWKEINNVCARSEEETVWGCWWLRGKRCVRDRVGRTLPTLTSLVEGACQYKQQERTDTRWQRGIHLTVCLPRKQSSFALFGAYLKTAGSITEVAFRLLNHPQQDAMCLCSLTARLAWPWPTKWTHHPPTGNTCAINNIHPTCRRLL